MTDDPAADNEPAAGSDGSASERGSRASAAEPAASAAATSARPGGDPAGAGSAERAPVPAGPAAGLGPKRLPLLLILAAVLYGLDLLTKSIAVARLTPGDPVYLIGDVVRFSLVRNPGAAFSMATGMTWLLTLVAAGVVIAVIRIGSTLRSPWWAVGLGMVLGGALGNLTDRLFRAPGPLQGHVVDFMAVGWWPVFNVADSAIVCGAILLVALTVFGFEPDGTRSTGKQRSRTAGEEPA